LAALIDGVDDFFLHFIPIHAKEKPIKRVITPEMIIQNSESIMALMIKNKPIAMIIEPITITKI
jgi:hypothetical protein